MKATIAIFLSMVFSNPALAATFVYVSNADDGEIGSYTLQADGSLKPGQRIKAEKIVMPMAVSPDKRFTIAAVRSKPYQAYSYLIDPGSGGLKLVGTGSLAESFPYISLDRSGRFLFGASYGANLVSVNPSPRTHSIISGYTRNTIFISHCSFPFSSDVGSSSGGKYT